MPKLDADAAQCPFVALDVAAFSSSDHLHDPMHARLERAAAGEEGNERQRERADRGLVGERVRERIHNGLKDDSRVREAKSPA
jgi:hypothetical protein